MLFVYERNKMMMMMMTGNVVLCGRPII